MSRAVFKPIDALGLLVLTTASIIGINQYAYGVYNHCITIPFIKSLVNPEFYPNDYLVAEIQYFYSLFLPACSFIVKYLGISLPIVFFLLYAVSIYATLLAFFLLALKLFERKEVAYFSTMFLLFSLTTLGQEKTVENILMERTLALPVLLFSFYAYLSRHYNTSALLAGIAFLFHPLSASYVMVMLIANMLFKVVKERQSRNLLAATAILAVVVSPLFIIKLLNPAPGLSLIHAGSDWVELLRIRSSFHVFPSTWSKVEILESILLVAGFILAWKYKPAGEHHQTVVVSFVAMLVLFFIGTVFTELIPVSVVIQFQLFRSFKFLVLFAIIYYANYLFREPDSAKGLVRKLLVTTFIIAPYFHESKTVFTCLLLLLFTVYLRNMLRSIGKEQFKKYLIPAQALMLLAMGIAGSLNKVHFSIGNAQEDNWLSVQQWAREHTPVDAAFIVPPYLEGFRIESERTSYGEWKDGTQMFFDPPFGNEWMRRMQMLGYDDGKTLATGYKEMTEGNFKAIADEMKQTHPKVFLVVSKERGETLNFPEVFANGKYSVREVTSVDVARLHLVENGSHELFAQTPQVSD